MNSLEVGNRYTCKLCKHTKSYSHKRSLTYHMKQIHQITEETSPSRLRVCCQEENCMEKFASTEELGDHLASVHNIEMCRMTNTFTSYSEFNAWKSEVERATAARFVAKRSWKKKDHSTGRVFNCNRSGTYRPTVADDKRKRRIKSQGSRKIGQLCPARMLVTEYPSGVIDVSAMLTHYGHVCQLNHISFSKEERSLIQGKLVQGYSPETIIKEIRQHSNGKQSAERIDLASNKDLCNILYGMKRELEKTREKDAQFQAALEMGMNVDDEVDDDLDSHGGRTSPLLHVEVLQGIVSTEAVSPKLIQNLCSTLQGCILTHKLDNELLFDIEQKLRSCIATFHTHGERSILVDNIPSMSLPKCKRGRPRKTVEDKYKHPRLQLQTTDNAEVGGMTDNESPLLTQIVYEDDPSVTYTFQPGTADGLDSYETTTCEFEFNPNNFLKKVCNRRGQIATQIGYPVKAEDLNLPENLQNYDTELLDADIERVAGYFEEEALEKVEQYIRKERAAWKCSACNHLRKNTEMIKCFKCPLWYHFSCVGLEVPVPEKWTCPNVSCQDISADSFVQ